MAAFLINQIILSNVKILDVKFHKKTDLLAISVIKDNVNGNIIIANNRGKVFDECTLIEEQPCSTILWHPTKTLLAAGWSDGSVNVYDASKNVKFKAIHIHILPISCFCWSSHGTRLISADIEGHLNCWKIDFNNGFSSSPLFSYDSGCSVNCIVLRVAKFNNGDVYDIRELARAAVSGDQKAMNIMSSSETGNIKFTGYSYVEEVTFLAGLSDGRIVLITDSGKIINITSLDGSVIRMLYHEKRDLFIATTDSGILAHHQLMSDGTSHEVMKVKLSSRTQNPYLIWAGPNTLAISLGENMVRMWDIDREDNYNLQPDEVMGYIETGHITAVDYCVSEKTLLAGSSSGQVISWKLDMSNIDSTVNINVSGSEEVNLEDQWCLQPVTNISVDKSIQDSIEKLVCSSTNLVAVSTTMNHLYLLEEYPLCSSFNDGIIIQQINNKEVVFQLYSSSNNEADNSMSNVDELSKLGAGLEGFDAINNDNTIQNNKNISMNVQVEHNIRFMTCTQENMVISDGEMIYSYEFDFKAGDIIKMCGTFECSSKILRIHQLNIYIYVKDELQIRNFQGTIKQIVDLSGMDGELIHVEINNNFMICATDKCFMKVFDLSRRDPKPINPAKDLSESIPSVTAIKLVAINCNGTAVSMLVERQRRPDSKLYFWDIENDGIQFYNFSYGPDIKQLHNEQRKSPNRQQLQRKSKAMSSKTGLRSARDRNRRQRKRAEAEKDNGGAFSVAQSILYDSGSDDNEDDGNDSDEQDDINLSESPSPFSTYRVDSASTQIAGGAFKDIHGTTPVLHMWDRSDPRIVVVAVRPLLSTKEVADEKIWNTKSDKKQNSFRIASLFVTQDDGIMVFDTFIQPNNSAHLIGFDVPYFYLSNRIDVSYRTKAEDGNNFIQSKVMRDFEGLENLSLDSNKNFNKKAIINFSYYLTIGNMDEAFKAMKLIKSEKVWQNMARMCVKTRRLDVATVCLARMNFGRAALHLREARQNIQETDARIAMLALQLDMKEEAIELLIKSRRYDILNELYQAMEEWDRAIEIAETYDRIHLKTTYYNYAKYLEEERRYTEAIQYFVKSETHTFEVPRMLLDDPNELERFIRERPEKSLKKWWAQYMECIGYSKDSLQYYEAANDYLSMVRIYWTDKRVKEALQICDETGDLAACYHTARQFENNGDIDRAIHYFSRARAYNNAIRVCQANHRDEHLVNLALLGKPEDQMSVASYLETRPGYEDKAVMLWHKAGQVSRAVTLAFQTRQFSALQHITAELSQHDQTSDPGLIQKCATFFMENNQFDKAVDLLANNKQLWDALKLCIEYNVLMSEELAEKLTPQRPHDKNAAEADPESRSSQQQYTDAERNRLLEGIAEIAISQRQYHVACKKFTQAGNQTQAMKSLLKSGDTHKIIFFTNVAKTKDVYVLAANYLQTLDWRQKLTDDKGAPIDILKNIAMFYTKGKALDRLAGFYEAAAQSEVDEYKDYEKSLSHLNESMKCWNKVKFSTEDQKVAKINELKERCNVVEQFVTAKKNISQNPDIGLQQLQTLLDDPNLERAVRYGDVYATMIRYFMSQNKYKAAYSCLNEMKQRIPRHTSITSFIDLKTLEILHKELNLEFRPPTVKKKSSSKSMGNGQSKPSDGDDEFGLGDDDGDDDDDDIDDIDDKVAAAIDGDL